MVVDLLPPLLLVASSTRLTGSDGLEVVVVVVVVLEVATLALPLQASLRLVFIGIIAEFMRCNKVGVAEVSSSGGCASTGFDVFVVAVLITLLLAVWFVLIDDNDEFVRILFESFCLRFTIGVSILFSKVRSFVPTTTVSAGCR